LARNPGVRINEKAGGDREKPGAERIAILGLVQVTTAEPVSYAKSRPCFERGMARDAVASATRDAGDIRCEVGIAPVFSWSPKRKRIFMKNERPTEGFPPSLIVHDRNDPNSEELPCWT
jgi:hypothetical protein